MHSATAELLNRSAAEVAATPDTVTVRDVMTTDPTCVGPNDSVLQLVRVFHEKQFRHLLVTDGERHLLGVVSDRDVVRCFGPTDYPDQSKLAAIKAHTVMSPDVITIDASAPLVSAIDRMYDEGVSCLPVVEGGRLAGIITTSDLMRLLRRILVG
jgi:acetoin utilization protein AcuB